MGKKKNLFILKAYVYKHMIGCTSIIWKDFKTVFIQIVVKKK
jgi:hypothetical protein